MEVPLAGGRSGRKVIQSVLSRWREIPSGERPAIGRPIGSSNGHGRVLAKAGNAVWCAAVWWDPCGRLLRRSQVRWAAGLNVGTPPLCQQFLCLVVRQ